jgi:hypothetical protein
VSSQSAQTAKTRPLAASEIGPGELAVTTQQISSSQGTAEHTWLCSATYAPYAHCFDQSLDTQVRPVARS